jgi:hypothetical protein
LTQAQLEAKEVADALMEDALLFFSLRSMTSARAPVPISGSQCGPEAAEGAAAAEEAEGIVAANRTKITGYTMHGLNRAIGDGGKRAGTKASSILDALKNPKAIKSGVDDKGRPFQVFKGSSARVVVNPVTGQIVSVNPIGGAGVR